MKKWVEHVRKTGAWGTTIPPRECALPWASSLCGHLRLYILRTIMPISVHCSEDQLRSSK